MSEISTYTNLITSEYQEQPNFMAVVGGNASIYVQIQNLYASMIPLFDLATPPVGNQLDIIGEWVGISRYIAIPISGVYFTWDSTALLGWDSGTWQDPNQPASITTLPDDAYLTLILAKIAANNWDGTTEGAYAIWDQLFPNLNLLIQDNQNMSFTFIVQGSPVDALTQALLTGGYIPLRPEGVQITEYVFPINTGPLFGFDLQNEFIQGWNDGSWGIELAPT